MYYILYRLWRSTKIHRIVVTYAAHLELKVVTVLWGLDTFLEMLEGGSIAILICLSVTPPLWSRLKF